MQKSPHSIDLEKLVNLCEPEPEAIYPTSHSKDAKAEVPMEAASMTPGSHCHDSVKYFVFFVLESK